MVPIDDTWLEAVIEPISMALGDGPGPVLVAIDGRSGAGKSTLARAVARRLPSCTVVDGDEFYGGGSAETWDGRTAAEKVEHVIDWRGQRPVLEALAAGRPATWYGYDWAAFDGRRSTTPTVSEPAAVVILDGAYSARPELADLFQLRVLVDPPAEVRRAQLLAREGEEYRADWEARWSEAEDHYFGSVVLAAGFDLVLT